MHHEGASIRVEQCSGSRCEGDAIGAERDLSNAAGGNDDIGIVARVRSPRILEPMLHTHRVVVRARGRKSRRSALAFSHLMEVDSMRSGRERDAGNFQIHEAVVVLPDLGGADWRAAHIVHDRRRSRRGVLHSLRRRTSAAQDDRSNDS